MLRTSVVNLLGVSSIAALCGAAGCNGSDEAVAKRTPDGGASSPGTGGAASSEAGSVKAVVRSSCANMPILDDRWTDTSDDCKSCFDTECCDEAQACGDDPKCKELWECRARCDNPFASCILLCARASGTPLPVANSPLITCRNSCAACIDTTSCAKGPWPAPPKASYPMTVHFSNLSSGVPFPDAHVKVCKTDDTECAAPLSEGVTDASGNVDVEVPSSPEYTSAYFDLSGPNVQATLIFVRGYHAKEKLEGGLLSLSALDTATSSAFLGSLGAVGDPTKVGTVTAYPFSCLDHSVQGLTAEASGADASTIRSYLVRGIPSTTAMATDSSGGVAFVGQPPGPTTITVKDGTGAVFGTADAFVRAGAVTGVYVLPTH